MRIILAIIVLVLSVYAMVVAALTKYEMSVETVHLRAVSTKLNSAKIICNSASERKF